MNQIKSRGWQTLCWSIISRCFFLYLVLGFIIFSLIDQDALITTRINFLMQSEVDVKAFAGSGRDVDPQIFRLALRYYRELSYYVPKDGIVQGNMGFCYFYLKDYRRSLEAYQRATKLEPHVGSLQWDLAMALFQNGKIQEAVSAWEGYLQFQPVMKQYFQKLQEKMINKKRLDALRLALNMEKRFLDDEAETYVKLSEAYFLLKKYDLSRITAVAGLKLSPNNRSLAYMAGLSEFFLKNLPEAVQYFTRTIAINPTDINAYYYRSQCLKYLGDKKQESQDLAIITQLHARGAEALPFPSKPKLHFNTEMLTLRYHLNEEK